MARKQALAMALPQIYVSDCFHDSDARAQVRARVMALTGLVPGIEKLPIGLLPERQREVAAFTSHLLYRTLMAGTTLLGHPPQQPVGLAINGAPRNGGGWQNGVQFCQFQYRNFYVSGPYDGRVLRHVRRYLPIPGPMPTPRTHVKVVTDIAAAMLAMRQKGYTFTAAEAREIASDQFRSLLFQPHHLTCIMQGAQLPTELREIPVPEDDEQLRIIFDGFKNGFLNKQRHELGFEPGQVLVLQTFDKHGELVGGEKVACVAHLTDIAIGDTGLVLGSPHKFPMLAVGCGKAKKHFRLRQGQAISLEAA